MEEREMTKTITGRYDASLKIKNAQEDLIASGIDREKIFPDEEAGQLKVMVPSDIEPEIVEILKRHQPSSVEIH